MRLALIGIGLAGCTAKEVEITGTVLEGHSQRSPLASGEVRIVDAAGEPYATATTDAAGEFSVMAPRGETIYAGVTGEGYALASFTGVSGLSDTLAVEDGALFGVTEAEVDAERALYSGCPGGDGAGIVFGEVGLYGFEDPITHSYETVSIATAVAIDVDGNEFAACYLDAEGVYDGTATVTGETGRFAIVGLSKGLYTLVVSYTTENDISSESYGEIWVPDGEYGAVPKYPAWVEFPY